MHTVPILFILAAALRLINSILCRGIMNLSGEFVFDASQEIIWDLLMDPGVVANDIPGIDEFIPIEGEIDAWHAKAKISVASVSGTYVGTVRMSEQAAPAQYRLTVNGEGQQSIIGGSVLIKLAYDVSNQQTILTWDAETNVSGKLARVGQRVIGAAAKMMSRRFFASVAQQIDVETTDH